jgi:hypothetical protein
MIMDSSRILVIACATVIEEMLPILPEGMQHRIFDFGLHINPARLRETMQEAIDKEGAKFETILLGYGLCSQALVGIRARNCRLRPAGRSPALDESLPAAAGPSGNPGTLGGHPGDLHPHEQPGRGGPEPLNY